MKHETTICCYLCALRTVFPLVSGAKVDKVFEMQNYSTADCKSAVDEV
jgi:hypothetical protein